VPSQRDLEAAEEALRRTNAAAGANPQLDDLVTAARDLIDRRRRHGDRRRPSWQRTMMDVAKVWAARSTCPRLSTGAVISNKDCQTLTAGYNGAVRGAPHCSEAGCLMEGGHCVRSVHAEMNAVAQAARTGVSIHGATIYSTHRPCVRCAGILVQVGIYKVYYESEYDSDSSKDAVTAVFNAAGVYHSRLKEED
jgi:dCMP deaminase